MRRTIILAATAALALTVPVTGVTDAQAQRAPRGISAAEARQGAAAHPQLLDEYGGSYGGAQDGYVARIGQRVAAQSGLADAGSAIRVTLLNSPVNNAFAVPGGYVYVTRQLLALMNDEAELAAVLGHEVGHVAARHGASRSRASTFGTLGAVLVGVLTGSSAATQLASQAAQLVTLRYSRSQEYESDDLGVRYLAGAGYDPAAMGRVLAALAAQGALDARLAGRAAQTLPSFASTHPDPGSRVARALSRARQYPGAGREQGRDAFLAALDGLIYGDDPRQGVIDGQAFLHPELRLAFRAPPGFQLTNGTRAVTIAGPGGQAQFAGASFAGDLQAYVERVFAGLSRDGRVAPAGARRGRVNGLDTLSATARVAGQQGPLDVTVTAYAFAPDRAYHVLTVTPAGQGIGPFQPLIDSVRRLSAEEAARIPVREIDIVTVRPGDTPQRLAQNMAFADAQLDRFLVLNGLSADAALRPGDRVKLVVYRR